MKLKGLHFADVVAIQVGVTDKLNRSQKDEFSEASQKLYDRVKACIYAKGDYFEFKNGMCLPHASLIFKKSVLKLLDRTVYIIITLYPIIEHTILRMKEHVLGRKLLS
jgi:hypothetical protein